LNFVCANTQEEESIYPLTIKEIAEAQTEDADLKTLAKADKYEKQLVEDTSVYCKDCKLVIPKPLQRRRAEEWYHHYLQYPGYTRLEETLRGSMYWKGM
jgi:ribosomal protein L11 methylase PrmA